MRVKCGCGLPDDDPVHDDPRAGLDPDETPDPVDAVPGAHPIGMPSLGRPMMFPSVPIETTRAIPGSEGQGQPWFVFTAEGLWSLLAALDVNFSEALEDVYNNESPATAVIDCNQAWAGPALHLMANMLAVAREVSYDADQAKGLRDLGDYYEDKAMEADNGRMDLPGQDEPT